MTSYIVVFGLIVVVVLVVVLVALGLRASRAGRDDDDWMDDEPQKGRGRRGVPPHEEMGGPDDYGPGYNDGYNEGYDGAYDGGYDRHGAPEPANDRRVAGGPLAAPTAASAPPPPVPNGQASDEMEDDDYWATITFDKPKFPWQHDHDDERSDADLAADPLNAQAPVDQPPVEQPNLTQPVSMGAEALNGIGSQGGGTGPQQMQAPGGHQGGSPFAGHDPGSTALDPIPADLGGGGVPGGPQPSYGSPGMPDQQVYGGPEPQPAYGAADYGPGDPSYGGPGQDQYGGGQDQGYADQPQYGTHEPSYGDYGSDPLGTRPAAAAGPPPAGRQDGYARGPSGPGGPRVPDPRVSDPLGLPLGRPEEPAAPPPSPVPAAPAAHGRSGGSDTDGHKLPTVDELLQRIQSDRQRSANAAASPASPASPDPGGSYGGGSLNDPLGDPLGTGSFGTTGGTANTGNTGPWPSGGQTGGYDSGLGSGMPSGAPSAYDSGLGAPSGYGQGQQNDGYPTSPAYGDSSPAYGDSPRYDDPLGGGREPYGGSGGGPGGTGVYGDFSGSSYNGGADPLAAPHDPGAQGGGYADPNATQAYGSGGYYGGSQQQGGYPQNDNGPYGSRQPADDWENYRR